MDDTRSCKDQRPLCGPGFFSFITGSIRNGRGINLPSKRQTRGVSVPEPYGTCHQKDVYEVSLPVCTHTHVYTQIHTCIHRSNVRLTVSCLLDIPFVYSTHFPGTFYILESLLVSVEYLQSHPMVTTTEVRG